MVTVLPEDGRAQVQVHGLVVEKEDANVGNGRITEKIGRISHQYWGDWMPGSAEKSTGNLYFFMVSGECFD
jgi:hypothetical protein